ncbi:fungal-specific transcription factor domain-containing protein [Aspergillus leporis]|uniref:Fungal-specific transcription factor domain-containing protein n=1 Tax=Aspergillus leporis TaxID=41062 RepID=A0A5N5WVB5_9EURO|nr:fungal-specific transcription factor domain-containing protein [Aspergillus leporis]
MQAELEPTHEGPAPKLRKVTRACDACKAKKKACTGTLPCGPCVRRKVDCTYNTTYNRGVAVSPPSSAHRKYHATRQGEGDTIYDDGPTSVISPSSVVEIRQEGSAAQSAEAADRYWGPTSAHSFLDRAVLGLPTPPSNAIGNSHDSSHGSTRSIFQFGDRVAPDARVTEFQWPSLEMAEALTVESTVQHFYQREGPGSGHNDEAAGASKAILLMVFSTATMFQMDTKGRMTDADESGWQTSELYFTKADQILSQETGAPRLESAQARLLMVLHLLSSSRAHRAWFTLGTTIQLIMALGLHSRRRTRDAVNVSLIQQECQCRVVWCSYTLEKYLSFMLGTPPLWHDEDLDEKLPARVNDQDVSPNRILPPSRDCVMDAAIFHALLARILSQAAKAPYVLAGITDREEINMIRSLCESVAEWHLIPLFQRQLTVLQLARYHALMFITRPPLLRNYGQIWTDQEDSYTQHLRVCLTEAKDTLFLAFWYSQYIAFNALSINYILLIQVQRSRILPLSQTYPGTECGLNSEYGFDESTLYELAETAQYHLAHATARNSPSWKYRTIMEGLRRELERLGVPSRYIPNMCPVRDDQLEVDDRKLEGVSTSNRAELPPANLEPRYHGPLPADAQTLSLFDNFTLDNDLILDLWPQLDSLPISAYIP